MVIAKGSMSFEDQYSHWNSQILLEESLDQDYCRYLTSKIQSLETSILALGPSNYPEAPKNSITTRHQYYNGLDLLGEDAAILKEKLLLVGNKVFGTDEILVKLWFNIFRQGEQIKRHMHHASPVRINEIFKKNIFKTVCGNLFLSGDADSETVYYLPERTALANNPGDIKIFSCTVEHETLPFVGTLRIGLAFDLYTKNFFQDIGMSTPQTLRLISKKNV